MKILRYNLYETNRKTSKPFFFKIYFFFFQIWLKNITFYIWLINLFFKGRIAGAASEVMIQNSDAMANPIPGYQTNQVVGFDHRTGLYSLVNKEGTLTNLSINKIIINPLHLEIEELDKAALQKV